MYEDEVHLFYGHNDYIERAIEDRMVSVGLHHHGCDRFSTMMAANRACSVEYHLSGSSIDYGEVDIMRVVLCVFLLTTIVVSGVSAEWKWGEAKPQPFQVFDDYVIAVGTKDKLEPVQASNIMKALEDGKEIQLKYAKIEGAVGFNGEVKKDVYFIHSKFLGKANFGGIIEASRLLTPPFVLAGVNVSNGAAFSAKANFTRAAFSEEANFTRAEFSRGTNFWGAKFSEKANFYRARFSGAANFARAEFSGVAYFWEAKFSMPSNNWIMLTN